jgi:DNA-directed RNA polymerase delta subunit
VAAVVLAALVLMVEMEHTLLEEQVEMVTYSHLTSKYQHQLWHLLHTEIQDRVVVHIG